MANLTKVYILHGWTRSTEKWKPVVTLLKKSGIDAKVLEIPGLTKDLKKPYTLNDYVSWFKHQIGDEHNINVIAHSFGGRIAIRTDIKNPNLIKKMVLIDSAGLRPTGIGARVKRASFEAVAKIGKRITQSPQARKFLYSLVREKDYYEAEPILAQTMTNVVKEDQRQELQFVKAHTLIIWGSQDKVTPIEDGRTMNKVITGSALKIIDGAKHSPQYTHPQEVARHITDFLHK